MTDKEMIAQDLKWQAESDARSLSESELISKDPKRLKAAKKAAKEMADKQAEEAKAMKKIADWPVKYKTEGKDK